MHDFLQGLQDSNVGVWVSSAPTIWAYPTILMLHTVGLAMIVGPNAVLDLRLLGVGPRIPLSELQKGFRIMWAGLVINASTGIALFISEAAEKGTQWIFYVKLGLIALAFVVALRTKRLMFGDGAGAIGVVPQRAKVLAVASLVLWLAAITAGRLMAYVK